MSERPADDPAEGGTREAQRDPVLEVRDLQVTYEMGRGRARVLDDIDLEIYRGETLGIVGESGCGKSMFASALLNAVEDPGIASGEVIYHPREGEPTNLLELPSRELRRVRWAEIALVYQEAMAAFNPSIPMYSHFTETFDAHGIDRETGLERARATLRDLNLDPGRILESHQHELSGGEKQRVLLALALVFDPEVLVLDEPTAGLDLLVQRNILSMLYDIREEYDVTLIYISHDIPAVAGFAERLAVMYAFDIIELGSAHDVLLSPGHPYTRLLLGSTLDLSSPVDDVQTIEGRTPDPVNVPAGCSFHQRCPIADDRCEVEEPELRAERRVGSGPGAGAGAGAGTGTVTDTGIGTWTDTDTGTGTGKDTGTDADTGTGIGTGSGTGQDHEVACFFPDVAVDRIPVSLGEGPESTGSGSDVSGGSEGEDEGDGTGEDEGDGTGEDEGDATGEDEGYGTDEP